MTEYSSYIERALSACGEDYLLRGVVSVACFKAKGHEGCHGQERPLVVVPVCVHEIDKNLYCPGCDWYESPDGWHDPARRASGIPELLGDDDGELDDIAPEVVQ